MSCNSSDSRAQAALGAYQAATASNNLFAARRALLQLVQAKDDVSDYWAELGKLQASMGSYNDAYYAFTRAYELDRSNPELIRALTELALRAGDIGSAQTHAQELEVIAPGDPWVKMIEGWTDYSESHFDQSLAISDQILAESPSDPVATALKAHSLISLGREDDAGVILVKQVDAQPKDYGSIQLLARIYEHKNDWAKVAECARRLTILNPNDQKSAVLLIKASLRAGDQGAARQAAFSLLKPGVDPDVVSSVLDLWTDYWPSPQRIDDARRLAAAASGDQRLVYADFMNRAGSPSDGIRLSAAQATLPVNARNAEANAVYANALWRTGNPGEAKRRFDAVLDFDPGNATALRGRSEFELRTGNATAAIHDAQKLVTVLPDSPRDRLLLARAFTAAGNKEWTDRTLWSAFQDIPADDSIYAALRATRSGNADAMNDIQEEFERQRGGKLNRGLL